MMVPPQPLRQRGQADYIAGMSRSTASRLPMRAMPSAIFGSSIVTQVPAGTSLKALP